MKFRILNRCNDIEPPFRKAMINLLSVKGDTLILGYGYMSDIIIRDTEIIESIKEGFKGESNANIIIVGKYGTNPSCDSLVLWNIAETLFNSFNKTSPKGLLKVNIEVLIAKDDRYHKKIAIKTKGKGLPGAVILGSSNFSANTISIGNSNFNQEIDILFWRRENDEKFQATQEYMKKNSEIIDEIIDKEINDCYCAAVEKGFLENITSISRLKKKDLIERMKPTEENRFIKEKIKYIEKLQEQHEKIKSDICCYNINLQYGVDISVYKFIEQIINELYDNKNDFLKIYPNIDSKVPVKKLNEYYLDFMNKYIESKEKDYLKLNLDLFNKLVCSKKCTELNDIFLGKGKEVCKSDLNFKKDIWKIVIVLKYEIGGKKLGTGLMNLL